MTSNQQNINPLDSTYDEGVWIIYDGDCPMCHMATHAYRLKQEFGTLHLINAREEKKYTDLLNIINQRSYDLDEGMVILCDHQFYHGAEAVWFMAHYGDRKNFFSLICAILFSSKIISKILYPFLRAGRNFLVWARGKNKINNLNK